MMRKTRAMAVHAGHWPSPAMRAMLHLPPQICRLPGLAVPLQDLKELDAHLTCWSPQQGLLLGLAPSDQR